MHLGHCTRSSEVRKLACNHLHDAGHSCIGVFCYIFLIFTAMHCYSYIHLCLIEICSLMHW